MLWHAIQGAGGFGGDKAWDVDFATYNGESFDVSTQVTRANDLRFKSDGTKMYILDGTSDDVNEYSLSTAWDVSTASYVQNFSVLSEEANPLGLAFKNDGTKMYVSGLSGDDVNEYSLSTAWDISTASYVQSFYVGSEDGSPTSIFFKGDGTKMYITGDTTNRVYEYSLSTAWDVSTASYVQNFSVSSYEAIPESLFFKDDGTKMYVNGRGGDEVNEFTLSTAWDISTASYSTVFSVASYDIDPTGVAFKDDGTKMYITGRGNVVFAFDIG